MKTVTLFRHAKSDWKDSAIIDDFDRPLSERGVKAAPKMGKVIRAHGLMPDIILCSPSVRTRQTLQLAAPNAFETLPEIRFDPKLYHPDVEALLHFLRALPETVAHVMIVGHNPALTDLITLLVLGATRPQPQVCELKKGGIAALRAADSSPDRAELIWVATPRLIRRLAGERSGSRK